MYGLQKVRYSGKTLNSLRQKIHLIFRIQSLIKISSERLNSQYFHTQKKTTHNDLLLQAVKINMSSYLLSPTVEGFRMLMKPQYKCIFRLQLNFLNFIYNNLTH